MDILAHGLWAGMGFALARRRFELRTSTGIATVALAVLPDILHVLPVAAWPLVGRLRVQTLVSYVLAMPGHEPAVPPIVGFLSHHLHCIGHSAIVAAVVTALVWWSTGRLWIPLLGWWSHIVIDVFTHSADYYPVPVLYPFTMWGFDGIAWNSPWFMAANYTFLVAAFVWLWTSRDRNRPT